MSNLPVPSPRTFTSGEYETAAYFNMLRDAVNFLANKPLLSVSQSTIQSVASSAWTSITCDASTVDTYGMHSNSTNNSRATAQVAGWYRPAGSAAFAANGTGARGSRFAKNGAAVLGTASFGPPLTTGNASSLPAVSLPVLLAVGDYLELQGFQTSGGVLNTFTASDVNSAFTVSWLHA